MRCVLTAMTAHDLAWLCLVFGRLQACFAGRAKLRQKRGACLGPAFQYLEVNRRRQRVMSASAPDAIQWLVSLSGARCSSRHLCLPKSRQEGSRTELEAKALARGTKPSSGHPD